MKRKRRAWWSSHATSPKALKQWFAARGRDFKPYAPAEIIFERYKPETGEELKKRLEKLAAKLQKERQIKTKGTNAVKR